MRGTPTPHEGLSGTAGPPLAVRDCVGEGVEAYALFRRRVNSRGYVEIQLGKANPRANRAGFQYEHRLVMEDHLGRRLRRWEEVHHLDGNPSNNDLLNLELMEKVDHAAFHSVYKPRDVLGRFRPEEGDLDVPHVPPGHASLSEVPF